MSKTHNHTKRGINLLAATTLALTGMGAVAMPIASSFASAPIVQAAVGEAVSATSVELGTGKVLKRPEVVVQGKEVGDEYALNADQIIMVDGKSYKYVDSTNNRVGRIGTSPVLVTHTYQEVQGTVSHISKAGDKILVPMAPVVTGAAVGSTYTINQPAAMLKDEAGRTYKYINSDGPLTGAVEEKPKVITHNYEEVSGSVVVEIRDDKGTLLTSSKPHDNKPVGDKYTTDNPETIIRHGGKTYKFVSSTPNTTGDIIEGQITVVHTYKEIQGSVTVTSIIEGGEVLEPKATVVDGQPVGDNYETAAPQSIIFKNGKTYKYVSSTDNTKGVLIEGTIDVVHTYVEVKELLPNTGAAIGLTGFLGVGILSGLGLVARNRRNKEEV